MWHPSRGGLSWPGVPCLYSLNELSEMSLTVATGREQASAQGVAGGNETFRSFTIASAQGSIRQILQMVFILCPSCGAEGVCHARRICVLPHAPHIDTGTLLVMVPCVMDTKVLSEEYSGYHKFVNCRQQGCNEKTKRI